MKRKIIFYITLFLLSNFIHSQVTVLDNDSDFQPLLEFNNRILGFNNMGFVSLDGVPENTIYLKRGLGPTGNYKRWHGNNWVVLNDKVYFSAQNSAGDELWVTDGTPEGTYLFKDLLPEQGRFGYPSHFKKYNGKIYFSGRAGREHSYTEQLWVSDGTIEGTKILKILPYNVNSSAERFPEPRKFNVINNKLIFQSNENEIWVTDGTEDGTIKIKQFSARETILGEIMTINDKIVFQVSKDSDFNPQQDFWVSDGTENGTVILKKRKREFFLYDGGSYINHYQTKKSYLTYNNKLYFLTSPLLKVSRL